MMSRYVATRLFASLALKQQLTIPTRLQELRPREVHERK
jgi:hypothetical protein